MSYVLFGIAAVFALLYAFGVAGQGAAMLAVACFIAALVTSTYPKGR